jgi:hypothetical protein
MFIAQSSSNCLLSNPDDVISLNPTETLVISFTWRALSSLLIALGKARA